MSASDQSVRPDEDSEPDVASGHERERRILVVCTANQIRSPMAQAIATAKIAAHGLPWTVVSAGTHAIDGDPLPARTEEMLESFGLSLPNWTQTALSTELIDSAGLVLTMTAAHRSGVVVRSPAAAHRCFLLKQLARMAEDMTTLRRIDGEADLSAVVQEAIVKRGFAQPMVEFDAVSDPAGRSRRHYRRCRDDLDDALTRLFGP